MKPIISRSVICDALTAVLVVAFGTTTWVSLGGLWVELPLLTNLGIPEGYKIGSYVIMVTQAAVIGPLIFITCQFLAPQNQQLEIPAIYITLTLGAAASFMLIFFWDFYSIWPLDGMEHSTAFLALVFFMALVDSTSNLTFMPFISRLKSKYLNWYFIGEGLSSVIPSFVVLIQGSGGDDQCVANYTFTSITNDSINNVTVVENCTLWTIETVEDELFRPQFYYTFIFFLFILSMTSFCLLRCLPIFRDQYEEEVYVEISDSQGHPVDKSRSICMETCFKFCKRRKKNPETIALLTLKSSEDTTSSLREQVQSCKIVETSTCRQPSLEDLTGEDEDCTSRNIEEQVDLPHRERSQSDLDQQSNVRSEEESSMDDSSRSDGRSTKGFNRIHLFLFIILTVISSLIYGVLPSIQSYSSAAYGSHTYLLVTALAEVSVPIGFLVVMVYPTTSCVVVLMSSLCGMAAGSYCLVVATLSPTPPLQGNHWGQILIIAAWISQGFFFSYCRATIGWILRSDDSDHRLSMMFFGGCTTLGTMLGAIIMFPIINLFDLFEGYHPTLGCGDQITCIVMEEGHIGAL